MLVLTRRLNQVITIGDPHAPGEAIEVTIIEVHGDQVRVGVQAPRDVTVHRTEIYEDIHRENAAAMVDLRHAPAGASR